MKLLAVLIAALTVELPWSRLTVFDQMTDPAHIVGDGGGFDEAGEWYQTFRRSRIHNTLDDVPVIADPPEWFLKLQDERTWKGTKRTWGK